MEASYARICENYGYEVSAVKPSIDHMRADVEADHVSLLTEALEAKNYLSVEKANDVMNAVYGLKEAFD